LMSRRCTARAWNFDRYPGPLSVMIRSTVTLRVT
jgi:hypothetical protein